MIYFYFLGQNGWSAKFLDIHKYLAALDPDAELNGLATGSGVFDMINAHDQEVAAKLTNMDKLIFKSLSEPLDVQRAAELEKYYGNLWDYINAERRYVTYLYGREFQTYKYSHEELLKIIVGQFDYFEKEVSRADVIITNPPASSWAKVMCAVAYRHNKVVVNLDQIGFPSGRMTLTSSSVQRWTVVDELYAKFKGTDEIVKWDEYRLASDTISEYRNKPVAPPWGVQKSSQENLSKWVNKDKIIRVAKRIYERTVNRKKDVVIPSFYLQLKQYFKLIIYKRYLRRTYKFDELDTNSEYYYYPLHVEPEASLMLSGKRALNQLSLIQRIAAQLPAGAKLYTKEHPTMFGWRNASYYDQLRRIPNVEVLNPYMTSTMVAEGAKAIFTVVGTTGWESLMLKKPVLIFGEAFYKNVPMIRYISDIDDISSDMAGQ